MKRIGWTITGGILMLTTAALALGFPKPDSIVPKSISKQVTSVILLPASEDITTDRSSFKYNDHEKLLSYTSHYAGMTLTISEQPTPESFVDIPEAYKKVIAQMNNYESFESINGTVHLTKPTQLKGLQTAVLNAKGTLTFIKPSKNLKTDEWKVFFRSFKAED